MFKRRSFHTIIVVALVAGVSFLQMSASAMAFPQQYPAARITKVSIDVDDATLTSALSLFFRQLKKSYRIDARIKGMANEKRTLHLHDVPAAIALEAILSRNRSSPYSYRIIGNVYVIEGPLVSLHVKNESCEAILVELLDGVGVDYCLPSTIAHSTSIDFDTNDVPFERAIDRLLKLARLSQVLTILSKSEVFVLQDKSGMEKTLSDSDRMITCKFTGCDRKTVVSAIQDVHEKNYVVNSKVRGTVTFKMTNISVASTLNEVLEHQGGNFTYFFSKNIYYFLEKEKYEVFE